MKSFFLIIELLVASCSFGQYEVVARIGMPIQKLAETYPITLPDSGSFTGLWRRPERVEHIKGEWQYFFTRDTLRDFRFVANPKALTKRGLKHWHQSAIALVDALTTQFGNPVRTSGHHADYKDLKMNIRNLKIKTASWILSNMEIHLEYGTTSDSGKPLSFIMTFHPARR